LPLALKNPAELAARLAFRPEETVLLVDAPEELAALVNDARRSAEPAVAAAGDRLRAVKDAFDSVLVWRENRVGAQALLEAAAKRVGPDGALWVVTAMRKVTGPATPAAHRLERRDLEKILAPRGLAFDRETRVSAWHEGHRFRRTGPPSAGGPRRHST
jgi:hypothetical protein